MRSYFANGTLIFVVVALEVNHHEKCDPPAYCIDRIMPHTHEEPQRYTPLEQFRVEAAQTTSATAIPASPQPPEILSWINSYRDSSDS